MSKTHQTRAVSVASNGNGRTNHDSATTPNDDLLISQLIDLWASHRRSGLGVRYELGSLLNGRLGPPTARQAHGCRTLKRAAEELEIAESELSRMRWFAHLFRSLSDLEQQEPRILSWTRLKQCLPGLIAKEKGQEPAMSRAENMGGVVLRGVRKSLDTVIRKLNSGVTLGDDERMQIEAMLQELAEAAHRHGMQIRSKEPQAVSVPPVSATPTPSVGMGMGRAVALAP